MALLLSAVAVLIPLIITPGLLFYYDVTPKVAILLIGAALAMQSSSVLAGPLPSRDHRERLPPALRSFALLLGIQAISLFISTANSAHWQLSLIGTNWRRFGLLSYLAVLAIAFVTSVVLAGRPDRMLLLLRSTVAGGLAAAAYGTAQYFGLDPWLTKAAYVVGEGEWAIVRPPSTLGHASYAATYYLFAVFAGIAVARTDRIRIWRLLGGLAAVMCPLAIILSGTRAAILGLVAGAVILAISVRPRITPRRIALAAIIFIAFAGFYVSPAGEKLRGRARWSMEDPRGGGRLLIWRDSLRMAASRPVIGWGPETFYTEFPRLQSRELSQAYPDFYYESPHNLFLDAYVSTGAIGLAAFVALGAFGLRVGWLARTSAPIVAAALASALIGSIVAQQFTVFAVPTALYFYITIAMLVALSVQGPVLIRARWWVTAAPAFVLIAFAFRLLAADYLMERSDRALKREDLKSASDFYRRSSSWRVPGPGSDLWYSRALAKSAQDSNTFMHRAQALQEGYSAAQRATVSAEDRHNAFYNLATYCATRNDFQCVESNLRQTIHRAPNWFKPHWTLAQALQVAGRLPEAEREAALAVDLDNGRHPEVARTLSDIRSLRARGDGN